MSLIKCPECNKDVSTKAAICPNCGAPISPPQETKVVTERTSKNLKGGYIVGWIVILLGIGCVKGNFVDIGMFTIIFGVFILSITGFLVWWEHD